MSGEKPKRFQQTLWDIQRRWGESSISLLSRYAAVPHAFSIPTGFIELDEALDMGGIRRSRITQLVGVPTSGMTTLALTVLAQAQRGGESGAYIDLGGTFDADYAARCGVDVDPLLVIRPDTTVKAFDVSRDLLTNNTLAVIIFDAVTVRTAALTTLPAAWLTIARRLSERLIKSRCAFLFLSGAPMPTAFDHATDTRLLMQRQAWLYRNKDVLGYQVQVRVPHKHAPQEYKIVMLEMQFDRAVDGDGT